MENRVIKNLLNIDSPKEKEELKRMREDSKELEDLFRESESVWQVSNGIESYLIPDKDRVWQKILTRIGYHKATKLYSHSKLIRIASMAAMISLIVGLSFSYIFYTSVTDQKEIIVKAPKGQKSKIILADGTNVWLNSESELSYDKNFNHSERRVKLMGEAFFDVTTNREKKFIVEINGIEVKVHGTSFNVVSYDNTGKVDVSLLEGNVTLHNNKSNKIIANLVPNQKAVIDLSNMSCSVQSCNANLDAIWKQERVKLDGVSAKELLETLAQRYGVCVSSEGELTDELFWLTIKDESLIEIINIINCIAPLDYSLDGKDLIIRFN